MGHVLMLSSLKLLKTTQTTEDINKKRTKKNKN